MTLPQGRPVLFTARGATTPAIEVGRPPATRSAGSDLLVEARRDVDRVLDGLPKNLVEARQLIAAALWPDPRPEELQLIVKAAADPSMSGPRRELPRHLLALRSRVESSLAAYRGITTLSRASAQEIAETLRILASATSAFDRTMAAATQSPDSGSLPDREYLARMHADLAPPKDRLAAATALAPVLVRLAEACESGDPRSAIPNLSDEEAAVLARYSPRADDPPRPFDREGLEVCCLRRLIEEDLAAWRAVTAAVPGEPADEAGRKTLARRLRIDVATYRSLSDRLQALHDAAISSHQQEVAERIGNFRRLLFSTYQKLAAALRDNPPPEELRGETAVGPPVEVPSAPRPLPEEPRVDLERDRIMRDALAGVARGDYAPPAEPQLARRDSGLRRLNVALAAVGAFLGVFWLLIPGGPPSRILTTPEDYRHILPLAEVQAVGTMLYARVEPSWANSPAAERLETIDELGQVARARGFGAVYVVDAAGHALGSWTAADGAILGEPTREGAAPAAPSGG